MVKPIDEASLPPEAHGDLRAEQQFYWDQSEAAVRWLDSLPDRAYTELHVLEVRCPVKGCLIGQVYGYPIMGGGERFLFLGVTSVGARRGGILNWAFSDDWHGPPVWFPVGCRHGHAKLELAWLLDLVGLVQGWHHMSETVEEARAKAPEAEQRGIRRRVFHPKPEVWRGK